MQDEVLEMTNKEDVDLSSFELKDRLNEKIWNGDKLNILVRRKLLSIARDFISDFDIADFQIEDVIMIGSLASFNWDERYSDIDLHIVIDFEDVNDNVELVSEFFHAVKVKWNEKHKGISIFGFPVEVFVQDVKAKPTASGIYSVLYDEWIKEPTIEELQSDVDKDEIQETTSDFMNEIDQLEERFLLSMDEIGDDNLQDIYDDAEALYERIKDARSSSLGNSNSEISTGNLIFKSLRRNGYLEKLNDIRIKVYDKINSIE